jgi:hypothetical protein
MAAVLRSGNLCPELEGIALEDSERIAGRMARQARRVPGTPASACDMCQRLGHRDSYQSQRLQTPKLP